MVCQKVIAEGYHKFWGMEALIFGVHILGTTNCDDFCVSEEQQTGKLFMLKLRRHINAFLCSITQMTN